MPLYRLAVQTLADTDPRTRPRLLRSPYQPGPVAAWSAARGPGAAASAPPGTSVARLAARRHLAGHAEQLRALVHSFAGLYLAHGGVHTRAALAAWLARDAGAFAARCLPLPGGPAARASGPAGSASGTAEPCADGREVLGGYAQLVHLLADMTADAGHHGLAQEYHAISLGLARQAGDRRMYAITLRAMSAHAGRLGQPAHAAHLARLAMNSAPGDGDPAVRAYLLAQRAAAHAHAGERAAALADLATADELLARAPQDPGPFDSYGRADLDFARARTHIALGEHRSAADALERSLRHRPPGHHRATALTHALLAETVLRLGHLTRACEHWRAFLSALPVVRSRAVREALGRLLRDLTPYRHHREAVPTLAMARAFAERLRDDPVL
ncbi:tol-pal system YbgF family protein [Streptomyces sp. NPDC096339]|uniref:tetratricopeptide repeat protein n=1 Tax=Streptomyces sp. NPDC096339 TaxID=3366086 RepID=UPI003802C69A